MRRQRAEHPEKYRAKSKAFTVKHSERLKQERNAHYAANKAEIRAKRRGVTASVIAELLALQNGLCAVCGVTLAPWPSLATHVDHCHDTGAVRGLLCRSCNMKEGWVRRYGAALASYLSNPPAEQLKRDAESLA
jgi:Recombination endonuclease VII